METQSHDYEEFYKKQETDTIKGYKLFLVGKDNKYYSLVQDNPMEFKEGEEYSATGDMAVGKNSYCFGTHEDLDIIAFAGYEANIAVGFITVYKPYFLFDDDSRDCCDIGYSRHIKIDKIMNFDEICKYAEESTNRLLVLIKQHKLDEEYIKHAIDKYEKNLIFLRQLTDLNQILHSENLKSYVEEKIRTYKQRH